jgi:predicted CXXCH cytochrome family protein
MFTKKTVHAALAGGTCGDCHHPHASDNLFQLVKPIDDLCISCHSEANIGNGVHIARGFKASGHPVKEKKDPRRTGREFACSSCHDPHSSDWAKLYRYKAQSAFELCQYCHKK